MTYNPCKHHRRSIRLKKYDYSQKGAYFVTICTNQKKCVLGGVEDSGIVLNEIGQIVQKTWTKLSMYYTGVDIDKFVVMPNHLHGIIILTDYCRGGVTPPCSMGEATSPLREPTLGQIVAHFKYRTTKSINQISNTLGNRIWQRNYYEHIIRNEDDLSEIREYIITNPLKWEMDSENPNNCF